MKIHSLNTLNKFLLNEIFEFMEFKEMISIICFINMRIYKFLKEKKL